MTTLRRGFACLILLTGTSAMAIEEPDYEVLAETERYEVRHYPAYVVAELSVEGSLEDAGNEAFRPLASFIFGENRSATEMEMTAPVTQQPAEGEQIGMTAPVTQSAEGDGSFVVRFVMPSRYTLETLPQPTNPDIALREEPEKVVAVLRYSGTWSEGRYRVREERLREAVEGDGHRIVGDAIWARFDSPFRLWFLRRNEIWLPIAWPKES